MRHEVIFSRDNGDVVKLITLTTANAFVDTGYENSALQGQGLSVKSTPSRGKTAYH